MTISDPCYLWDPQRGACVGPFEDERDADFWVNEQRLDQWFVISGPLPGYPLINPADVSEQAA